MTNLKDFSPRAVGLPWFREEDYPAALAIFDDADKMPRNWKEWLQVAEKVEQRLKTEGHLTERVYIDPDTFPDWCAAEGVGVDTNGRQKFVAVAVAEKYRNRS